jgi:hypothetical protein
VVRVGASARLPLHVVMAGPPTATGPLRWLQSALWFLASMAVLSVLCVMGVSQARGYLGRGLPTGAGAVAVGSTAQAPSSINPKEYSKENIPEKVRSSPPSEVECLASAWLRSVLPHPLSESQIMRPRVNPFLLLGTQSVKTFADVKGCDEAKAELEEIVEYLKVHPRSLCLILSLYLSPTQARRSSRNPSHSPHIAMHKLRIGTLGIRGGGSPTMPVRDARRFTSTRHRYFLSPRAKP